VWWGGRREVSYKVEVVEVGDGCLYLAGSDVRVLA
jgi:hypothetical protein